MNEEVKSIFRFNGFVINKNVEDITQEESLITSPAGGSCINWVLGHVVLTRDHMHKLLGIEKMLDEKFEKTYSRGAEKINPDDAAEIKDLLGIFNASQEKLMKILDETDIRSDKNLLEEIPGLSFHEAYHAGQTGILRRVIGKVGKIK